LGHTVVFNIIIINYLVYKINYDLWLSHYRNKRYKTLIICYVWPTYDAVHYNNNNIILHAEARHAVIFSDVVLVKNIRHRFAWPNSRKRIEADSFMSCGGRNHVHWHCYYIVIKKPNTCWCVYGSCTVYTVVCLVCIRRSHILVDITRILLYYNIVGLDFYIIFSGRNFRSVHRIVYTDRIWFPGRLFCRTHTIVTVRAVGRGVRKRRRLDFLARVINYKCWYTHIHRAYR